MKTATLSGDLTFATVLAHREALAPAVSAQAAEIDLSGVGYADSAGLSLLLELTRLARAGGHELRFVRVPPAVSKLAQFFGLGDMLPLHA